MKNLTHTLIHTMHGDERTETTVQTLHWWRIASSAIWENTQHTHTGY